MIRVEARAVLPRRPAELFDVVADPEQQLRWDTTTMRSVVKLTPGPLGRGSRYRGHFKGFGLVEYEYADYEPGRCFSHATVMPVGRMRHLFTLHPVEGGTELVQVGELEPNWLGRLVAPLFKRMLRRRFREIAAQVDRWIAR